MNSPLLIVLAEDNAADVFLVRAALAEEGLDFQLRVFSDGEKAVQFLEDIERGGAACPDLFLLDLNLPRLDGAEVLRRLRLVDGCANVPVIVMTSSDYRGDKERVGRLGVELYFLKTASLEEFMKLGPAVRGVLYNRRQES